MPKITAISSQTKVKNRCNLFVDGEFFAGVSLETVVKNRLRVGDDIERERLMGILLEDERSEALAKAADYVSKSLKTKKQVKDYLLKKGYAEDVVWYCVDKLKEYDYVNDVEYSKRYISGAAKNSGKRLIEYKLMMKGVNKKDIEDAYDGSEIDSRESAKAVAVKYMRNKEISNENKVKAYRYLIGKGFSYEETSYAITSVFCED